MVKITIPIEDFKEIEQRDKNIFFVRYDAVPNEDNTIIECSESGVRTEGVPTYGKLVSAIISIKYDINAQIAILANKGDGNPDHEAEYVEFETWRSKAKALAKSIFTVEEE